MIEFKKTIALTMISALALSSASLLSACGNDSPQTDSRKSDDSQNGSNSMEKASGNTIMEADKNSKYSSGKHEAVMEIKGFDPVKISLDADAAPITVQHFCDLVENGFYNGLTFYRFVDDFCMQGGSSNFSASIDPYSTQPKIKGEFSANGTDNPLADKFGYGTIAMARSNDMNSASTTFFITMGENDDVSASLNGQYAAFGTISKDDMKTIEKVMKKYSKNIDEKGMGTITEKDKQAKIEKITIVK